MKIVKLLVVILLVNPIVTFSYENPLSGVGYIENKGQIVNQNREVNQSVKYSYNKNNSKLLISDNCFSYQVHSLIKTQQNSENIYASDSYLIHRVDYEFLNSNNDKSILPIQKSVDYINYANSSNTKSEKIYHYEKLIYQNIWDDIDIIFYNTSDENFKYDLILNENADINDIKFKINGAKNIEIIDDVIYIHTSLGILKEYIPLSFTKNNKSVEVDYKLESNILSFTARDSDIHNSLTIDPLLSFASYYGGTTDDTGLEIATDFNSNVIFCGFTSSIENIATEDAYQTEFQGDHDAFLVKFNNSGQRIWATYFGGDGYDTGHALAIDRDGSIAMVGWTRSTSQVATTGAHQFFYSGGEFDSYISYFDSDGNLEWATYYGGTQDDYINDVIIDGKGDLICIGRSSSLVNISSVGAYQEEIGGGNDAFIVKFNNLGIRKWGTYYGGMGFDVGMEIAADIFGNIAITGFTQSTNAIASDIAHKKNLSGIWDAFVAKLTPDGERIWATYFGGALEDNGRGVDIDGNGNIYITGNTFSIDSISTPGVHQETIASEESDAFIAKFNSIGELEWASYYGGLDVEFGNMAIVNPWNEIMVSGNTSSFDAIASDEAFDESHNGNTDMFYSIFTPEGQLDYGTYYGGGDNDYGHGIALDKTNNVFLTGYTLSSTNISTSGSHQEELSGSSDAVVIKFVEFPSSDTIIVNDVEDAICGDNSIIIPYTAIGNFAAGNVFTVQLSNAQGMFTDFVDIGSVLSNSSGTILVSIPKEIITGTQYRVRITASNPKIVSGDYPIDLTYFELPTPAIIADLIACSDQEYTYQGNIDDDVAYKWTVEGGTITGADNKDSVNILWTEVGMHELTLVQEKIISSCTDSMKILIEVFEKQIASDIMGSTKVCPKEEILYFGSSSTITLNFWIAEGGEITSDPTNDSITVVWEEYVEGKLKLIQTNEHSSCSDSSSIEIEVFELPVPIIIGDTNVIAYQKSIFRTQPSSKYRIKWAASGGEIIGTDNDNAVEILWGQQGEGYIELILVDKETDCVNSLRLTTVIKIPPSDIINGDTLVCAHSTATYSYIDDEYSKFWIADGGSVITNDSLESILVKWDFEGRASLTLIRTHRETSQVDTITLAVKIIGIPEAKLFGNNELCEGFTEAYYTVTNPDYIIHWSTDLGTIIGDNNNDTVMVEWNDFQDVDDSLVVANLVLSLVDTNTWCTNNIEFHIFLNQNPVIDVVGDTNVCIMDVYRYSTMKEEGSDLKWTFTGGTVTSSEEDTVFNVEWFDMENAELKLRVESINGCIDSLIQPIHVADYPPKPVITQVGSQLHSSSETGNQWIFEGELIEDATEQDYIPDTSGYYTVKVTNEYGCESELSEPYYFDINPVIDYNSNDVVIYPNPVINFVVINFNSYIYNSNKYNDINIRLINIVGSKVYERTIQSNSSEHKINLGELPQGVYFVQISFDTSKRYQKKIVKY